MVRLSRGIYGLKILSFIRIIKSHGLSAIVNVGILNLQYVYVVY